MNQNFNLLVKVLLWPNMLVSLGLHAGVRIQITSDHVKPTAHVALLHLQVFWGRSHMAYEKD